LINILARTELLLESPLHLMLTGIMRFRFIDLEILSMVEGVTHPVASARALVDATEKQRTTASAIAFDKAKTVLNITTTLPIFDISIKDQATLDINNQLQSIQMSLNGVLECKHLQSESDGQCMGDEKGAAIRRLFLQYDETAETR